MIRLLFSTILSATLAPQALATTGWDRHELDILGKYRIHGANGASSVHRIDSTGQCIGPAVCGTIDATGVWNGLRGPPDYALAGSRLAIRYPNPAANAANCFLIQIDDGTVVGPLTASAFERAVAGIKLEWQTPVTAAEQFQRSVWLAGCVALIAVAGLAAGVSLWTWRLLAGVPRSARPSGAGNGAG